MKNLVLAILTFVFKKKTHCFYSSWFWIFPYLENRQELEIFSAFVLTFIMQEDSHRAPMYKDVCDVENLWNFTFQKVFKPFTTLASSYSFSTLDKIIQLHEVSDSWQNAANKVSASWIWLARGSVDHLSCITCFQQLVIFLIFFQIICGWFNVKECCCCCFGKKSATKR